MSKSDATTDSRAVLVTGASSGIGRATAMRLVDAGFECFATVRSAAARDDLERAGGASLHVLDLDVTEADTIARCAKEVAQATGERGLYGLVNNAGAPFPGPLELLPLDDFRDQLEVNLTGQLAVTQAFLPLIRKARGRIVFVSSLGGRVAFPFAGAYHASKFGLEAVGETMRQELRGAGVDVCLIEPGVTESAIWSKAAARTRDLIASRPDAGPAYDAELRTFEKRMEESSGSGMSSDTVAKVIERALTSSRPGFRYPVGLQAKLLTRFRPLIPDSLFDSLTTRLLKGGG
jgi:NAD(P)-dependent dehydrogenase (short-subunit alcohol dehydrogenase family)